MLNRHKHAELSFTVGKSSVHIQITRARARATYKYTREELSGECALLVEMRKLKPNTGSIDTQYDTWYAANTVGARSRLKMNSTP